MMAHTTTITDTAKLFSKIAKVMGLCRTLEKTGENKFDRYTYVTADAIAIRIGALLAENGVAFFPSMISVETNEYTTQKGGTNFRTVAHFQMTLGCTETGATFTSMWTGEAIDRSDKSISKAAVSAVKFFLIKTFLLAGGDEEDADSQSLTVEQRQAPQQPITRSGTNGTTTPTNAHSGAPVQPDAIFDEDAPERISENQLKRLNILGREYYGDEWNEMRPKLVIAVTTGATDSSKELSPKEADKLIHGIEKRLSERAVQPVAT